MYKKSSDMAFGRVAKKRRKTNVNFILIRERKIERTGNDNLFFNQTLLKIEAFE